MASSKVLPSPSMAIGVVFAAAFFLDGASVEVNLGSLGNGMIGGDIRVLDN